MPYLLSAKTVTARKEHRCNTCGAVAVQPGDQYARRSYVFDGRAYTWVNCQACDVLATEVWEWAGHPDEGVSEDDYWEWATDNADDPERGEAARAYLARRGGAA